MIKNVMIARSEGGRTAVGERKVAELETRGGSEKRNAKIRRRRARVLQKKAREERQEILGEESMGRPSSVREK